MQALDPAVTERCPHLSYACPSHGSLPAAADMAVRGTVHLLGLQPSLGSNVAPQPEQGTSGSGPLLSSGGSEQALLYRVTIKKRIIMGNALRLEKHRSISCCLLFLQWWLFNEVRVLPARELIIP